MINGSCVTGYRNVNIRCMRNGLGGRESRVAQMDSFIAFIVIVGSLRKKAAALVTEGDVWINKDLDTVLAVFQQSISRRGILRQD